MMAVEAPDARDGFVGVELGSMAGLPVLRHWFDLTSEAGLVMDLDPLGGLALYGMAFDERGEPRLVAVET